MHVEISLKKEPKYIPNILIKYNIFTNIGIDKIVTIIFVYFFKSIFFILHIVFSF